MNIGYHSARLQGNIVRHLYSKSIATLAKRPLRQSRRVPVSVYSFSCHKDLPEQVASIRSFIKYVGVPDKFAVVSDGSYNERDAHILCSIHSCVAVANYESIVMKELPDAVASFAHISPYGKKLALAMSLPILNATIMVDADVLFFRGAETLAELINGDSAEAWYLLDAQASLDHRMMVTEEKQGNPVNCGFMLLKKPLDWTLSMQRLSQLKGTPIPFTEQTVIHFAMHESGAKLLCAEKFVLRLDDQVYYTDWYAGKAIALRHYVGPVRHKMWFRNSN